MQKMISGPDQKSDSGQNAVPGLDAARKTQAISTSLSWRPTLVARFGREVQSRWNVYLFKKLRVIYILYLVTNDLLCLGFIL